MFQKIVWCFLLICTPFLIFSQAAEIPAPNYIKTIQFKGATAQSELPVVRLGEQLQLSFDALNGEEEDFYYTITHHNFDWTESDLSKSEYLDGFDDVRIETYENSLNTLQIFSHYTLSIPNRETRGVTKSGNYLITIYDSDNNPIFSRKFMVIEEVAGVSVEIKRSRDLKYIDEKQTVQFTINSPSLLLINPKQTVHTLVMQNSNLKTAITDLKPQYTLGSELVYKYDKISPSRALTFSWLFPKKKYELDTNTNGEHRAFVITGNYENVFPLDIYPLQILKACMVKDLDEMEALGMYEVAPEDFALTEFICVSKQPHQQIIRNGLDQMIKEIG